MAKQSSFAGEVGSVLEREFKAAETVVADNSLPALLATISDPLSARLNEFGATKHNARGVLVTLLACKVARPKQDIRMHKAEFAGGFNARSIDTDVTVEFLRARQLAAAAEHHFSTQKLVQMPYTDDAKIATTPKAAGILLPRIVAAVQASGDIELAKRALRLILAKLIEERNQGIIPLTKPKGLPIESVVDLLRKHFQIRYKSGAPRLPQIAIYAIYECLIRTSGRYQGAELVPLEHLKTANRKSGTVGDVDVTRDGKPIEAVEIKFETAVTDRMVSDAIEKIKTLEVHRYYILSTAGINDAELEKITQRTREFYAANGCEIIVNGVFDSLGYYLRTITATDEFVSTYVGHLGSDQMLGYEHRLAWNEICEKIGRA